MKILTAQQMQNVDARATQRFGIPSVVGVRGVKGKIRFEVRGSNEEVRKIRNTSSSFFARTSNLEPHQP
jgi:hypothetical protein